MKYFLGTHSQQELKGVHPKLVQVVRDAIADTDQDFTVFDGLRSVEQQQQYVDQGVSRTLASRHLRQDDGYGHAVDLVPYVRGRLRWEWEPCYRIATAMRRAARERDLPLLWGGSWERLDTGEATPDQMVAAYVERSVRDGHRYFIDAVHYQLHN